MELKKSYFGHPTGLFVLFFTEMGERFSYYGMRSLLVLYLTQEILLARSDPHAGPAAAKIIGFQAVQSALQTLFGALNPQQLSSQIYGFYTFLAYLTPLMGGYLADRYFGARKTVLVGGLLMALGHFLMIAPSCLMIALLLLALGNGCFKPNLSSQVSTLYPPQDPRLTAAFTFFYMGINLGAFFSPLICGSLGQIYGWHVGFAAAGLGMLLSLLIYWQGGKSTLLPAAAKNERQQFTPVPPPSPLARSPDQPTTRHRVARWGRLSFPFLLVLAVNLLFSSLYEQIGNTLQIFADSSVQWHCWGMQIPSTWFQAINPIFIFLLGPLFSATPSQPSGNRNRNAWFSFDPFLKMALGLFLLGAAFPILILALQVTPSHEKIHLLWMVALMLCLSIGELFLMPTSYALVGRLFPASRLGVGMGLFFISQAFGNLFSGFLGTFYQPAHPTPFFVGISVLGLGSATLLLLLRWHQGNALFASPLSLSPPLPPSLLSSL